ncbi:signal peptidase I [Paratissierella segnis]|jgi:signal peptidase I|uniref:Signal peptidase I n=1 Tax=Paratissierella segnis TaxID=2763679 RepID=A0A926ET37_9FIRM|nr:signal peptidase I [Paratissierella segnis]MBC8588020.1 signal peptidase I [Paratissierella segnis]
MLFKVTKRRKRFSFLKEIFEWLFAVVFAFIIALFIVSNIGSLTQVKEQSMEPTFLENDRVIINKIGYILGKPKRGDVVILSKVNTEKGLFVNMRNEFNDIKDNISYRFTGVIKKNNLIKRVIGIPGDELDIRDGAVYINGKLEEGYTFKGETFEESNLKFPLEVPENKVFVLGDNREYSLDSRSIGFIDYNQIKGKAFFRFFPFSRVGLIK